MADNSTTYTAVVETEVVGQDKLDGLGNSAQSGGDKFKSLRAQIRETTVQLQALADSGQESSAEFERLRTKLDGLNDAQDKVNFQAGQFDDQLASLPGPLGTVGKGIQSFNEGLNRFSTGFKVALGAVGLIIGVIAAFKESLSRTEEGQAKLNKITEAFTKIMNGLFAVIEPVAMMFADLLAGLLENEKVIKTLSVAMGVLSGAFTAVFGVAKELGGFIINNLVNYFKTLIGVAEGAGKVLKGVFTFDLALIEEGVKQVGNKVNEGVSNFVTNVKDTANGIGTAVVDGVKTGFEAGSNAFSEGAKRLTEEEKKAAEERKKVREEAAKKAAEEEKKLSEERKKAIEEGNKVATEAYLAGLEARDAEIFKAGEKLNSDLETLEKAREAKIVEARKAGITDLTAINEEFDRNRIAATEAYNRTESAINTKYDEEAKKKQEEKQQQEYDLFKRGLDERLLANDNAFAALLMNEADNLDQRITLINEREQLLLSDTALTEAQRTQIVLQAEAERRGARMESLDAQLALYDQEIGALGTSFDRQRELISQKEAALLQQEGLTQAQRTLIAKQASEERKAIDMAELDAKAELQNAQLDLVGQFGSLLQQIAGKNKKVAIAGIVVEQAAAIGKIIQNTAVANAKSVAALPLTGGMPFVAINTVSAALSIASSIAAGAKAINQIKSSDSGAGASSGGGSGGSLPRASAGIQAPQIERAGVPQITGAGAGAGTATSQIAQTMAARDSRPLKAYVVSGDVTSAQALDRRTTRAATFTGG